MHDVIVIGGGVAGSLAAALANDLEGVWIHPVDDHAIQSLQWHGYLHRGYLYDPAVELDLIASLRLNVAFWSSLDGTPFIRPQKAFVIANALSERHRRLPHHIRSGPAMPDWARSHQRSSGISPTNRFATDRSCSMGWLP